MGRGQPGVNPSCVCSSQGTFPVHSPGSPLGSCVFYQDKCGSSAAAHFPVLPQMQEMFCSLPAAVSCSLAASIVHPAQPPGLIPGPHGLSEVVFASKVPSGISAPAVLGTMRNPGLQRGFFTSPIPALPSQSL